MLIDRFFHIPRGEQSGDLSVFLCVILFWAAIVIEAACIGTKECDRHSHFYREFPQISNRCEWLQTLPLQRSANVTGLAFSNVRHLSIANGVTVTLSGRLSIRL